MLNLGLQFFAHKKESAPQRTAEIPSQRDLVLSVRTVSSLKPETFFTDSVEPRSIPE